MMEVWTNVIIERYTDNDIIKHVVEVSGNFVDGSLDEWRIDNIVPITLTLEEDERCVQALYDEYNNT